MSFRITLEENSLMKFEKRKFTLVLRDVFAAVAVVVVQAPYFDVHGGKFPELVSSFLSQDSQ